MKNSVARAVKAALVFAALAGSAAFATPSYTVLDLNPSGVSTIGYALGANGSVTGMTQNGGTLDAFVTGANGLGFTDLGNYTADYANAVGSDGSGNIAIDTPTGGAPGSILLGSDRSTITSIPNVDVSAINASGQIAANEGSIAQYLNSASGTPVALTEDGWQSSSATGINSTGQVVGTYYDALGNAHAFVTGANGTGISDLGSLGGGEYGTAINASGQTTGEIFSTDFSTADLLRTTGTSATDLGTLEGSGTYMFGQGINDAGAIVGISYNPTTGSNTPFLYSAGTIVDLTTLVNATLAGAVSFSGAPGINDAGQILLTGTVGGSSHTYLLTPLSSIQTPSSIPAPGVWGLMGLGLLGLGLRRRKVEYCMPSGVCAA
jgi:probable HAF family extracellular repeat protein